MGKGGGGGEEGIAVASAGPLGCSGFRRENSVHLHDASGSSFHFPRGSSFRHFISLECGGKLGQDSGSRSPACV